MSKRQSLERLARKTRAVLRNHVGQLVEHTLAVSQYNAHGQAQGKQGRTGHVMPKSNLHLQSGARLPQNIEDGFGADDLPEGNYGTGSVWVEDADFSHGFVVEPSLFLASHVPLEPSSVDQVPEIDRSLYCVPRPSRRRTPILR